MLVRGLDRARDRKNAVDIAEQVRLTRKLRPVPYVLTHRDCDAVEPAHEALSATIEDTLAQAGITAVAATPAWEIEAWLWLWPDALVAVHAAWRRPRRDGTDVGRIKDAKETLRRDLRPGDGRARDDEEADAPRVIERACAMGLLDRPAARSASWARFIERLATVAD